MAQPCLHVEPKGGLTGYVDVAQWNSDVLEIRWSEPEPRTQSTAVSSVLSATLNCIR